ncbi:Holliday junction branch migration DNA helicase RuvB [Desulfonauticus submarinus]|uniref:Holliday junction branch migration complex subunit RuvB n=1 Tax=Desulfonauticus submarinus TaxID=206665 RepID=A0A1H0GHL3_9BACT|nr:Holliday junction branch migration DNA helicase RuvB [Desulfonauticus submarinus]SDO06417.1 Holliday junction DNA helicase subunit RuvB [Desulfonauticus submarinus]
MKSGIEDNIRPQSLDEFIGQEDVCNNLKVYIQAARERGQHLDHTLLYGNPGLGKTTLAYIMAKELGVNIVSTSGPVLERSGDLAAILTSLKQNDILFIDEIHRLHPAVEEVLYPSMEDFKLDLIIGQGPGARTVKIDLEPFTLVGATTRLGLLTSPLRDRFGVICRLNFYKPEELAQIVLRAAKIIGIEIEKEAALEIGRRSRGTPRIANRLLRRVRDFAHVKGLRKVSFQLAKDSLDLMDVDAKGLDIMDRKILECIILKYGGGPVGVKTIAAAISEEVRTIEEIYEPFLIQSGFIKRTPRGRIATPLAYKHLQLSFNKDLPVDEG